MTAKRDTASPPAAVTDLLETANRHWREQRKTDAIAVWRQVLRLDPDNHAALYHLGHSGLSDNRVPEAIRMLRRAIALRPDFGAAHHVLGIAFESLGDAIEAVRALQRAVALTPNADALFRLATLLLGLSDRVGAIAAFRRAAAAEPDTSLGQLALANALLADDRHDEAETVLRRSLARDPNHFDTSKTLGDLLFSRGRFDEAEAEYQRVIAGSARSVTAWHGLVTTRKLTRADRPLVTRMRQILREPSIPDHHRMILHFALGKALDDLRDYPGAMRQFDAANRLRGRNHRLDRAALVALIDRTIDRCTKQFLGTHTILGDPDARPVLIVGLPRSGTTLTEQIISRHQDVAAGGELLFWREQAGAWEATRATGIGLTFARRVTARYREILRNISPDARRVTDKAPGNFLWLGLVHVMFPNARIIHCRRNPIDTCLSLYSTFFTAHMDFVADRGDLVFSYAQYQRLMDHWKAVLPGDRFFESQYEDLVAAPEPHSRALLEFCGLDWDAACLTPERNQRIVRTASVWQARQKVYRTSVERWRRYEPYLGELRDLLSTAGSGRAAN